MNNSKTSVTPIVANNGGTVTHVGASVSHSTHNSHLYAGATREVGPGGSSTFFAGTSRNISSSSTVGAGTSVNTKGSYSANISFERKF